MINITNRSNMLEQVSVDSVSQYDINRIDFKDFDFGTPTYTMVKENERARPDLLALRTLGTPNYWWFIMWYNGFSDPWHDLMPDTIVKVPNPTKVLEAIKKYRKQHG